MQSGLSFLPSARATSLVVFFLAGLMLAGCAGAQTEIGRQPSYRLAEPEETSLGQTAHSASLAHPNKSGHVVLDFGRRAFNARVALAVSAERTLDAQYYIWNGDLTGKIMAAQVVAAADRGVRVRLLVDDYGIGEKDKQMLALDVHKNIEVRVYNPFNAGFRSGLRKWGNFVLGFARLNRRMHSKTFIADNSIVITGGRNIGDEYFDTSETVNHRDRDILSTGPVVDEVSEQFDTMWNDEWAVPIAALNKYRLSDDEQKGLYLSLLEAVENSSETLYPLPYTVDAAARLVAQFQQEAIWAPTRFVYNPPAITRGDEVKGTVVGDELLQLMSAASNDVLIESAYFTVLNDMLAEFAAVVEKPVSVRVVTNSLATTDVWTIHAGYTRNREELLQLGVELYEWRSDAPACNKVIDNNRVSCGTFQYSLHAKTAVFDGNTVFVGSFNLNPRSHLLNTETVLIIESSVLAQRIAADIVRDMQPENSWRVALDKDGDLRWHGTTNGVPEVSKHEPRASALTRFKAALAAKLPLEKYW